jgi:hypothetical protein
MEQVASLHTRYAHSEYCGRTWPNAAKPALLQPKASTISSKFGPIALLDQADRG